MNVGSVIVYSFVRNVPKIQECWLAPVSLRGLTIKGVYEVSYSCYGQIIERVCTYLSRFTGFTFQWHPSNSVSANNGQLQFRAISSEDQGRYVCTATNPMGASKATAEVIVSSKFTLKIKFSLLIKTSSLLLRIT